jgi:hypothetical protein
MPVYRAGLGGGAGWMVWREVLGACGTRGAAWRVSGHAECRSRRANGQSGWQADSRGGLRTRAAFRAGVAGAVPVERAREPGAKVCNSVRNGCILVRKGCFFVRDLGCLAEPVVCFQLVTGFVWQKTLFSPRGAPGKGRPGYGEDSRLGAWKYLVGLWWGRIEETRLAPGVPGGRRAAAGGGRGRSPSGTPLILRCGITG